MMRTEDYDVTDFLAGIIALEMDIEEEEEEESEVYFDDESYFEPVPKGEAIENSATVSYSKASKSNLALSPRPPRRTNQE
jgi:hypothetical protein